MLIPRLAAVTNVSTQFDFWTSGNNRLPTLIRRQWRQELHARGHEHDMDQPQPEKRAYLLLVYQNHQCVRCVCFRRGGALCQTDTGELIDIIDDSVRILML
jgi:hypothetical protein